MTNTNTAKYNASILSAVGATGASAAFDCTGYSMVTFQTISTAVTDGATIEIQSSLDGTNYGTIATVTVSGNGSNTVSISMEKYKWLRANVTAWTDGAHTVHLFRGN